MSNIMNSELHILNLCSSDREFNSTPFGQFRFFTSCLILLNCFNL